MLVYQIFMGSYGDFKEMTSRLTYLKWIGADALYLTPIHPSPSYHGYDVLDYYAIRKEYGTMEDFKVFLETAHKYNIKIILDMVLCHTSNKHKWFLDSREGKNDFYSWSEKLPSREFWYPTPMNNCSWNQCGMTGQWYISPWCREMPSLNTYSLELRKELKNILHYWLDIGVDGFRFDAILHADLIYGKAHEFAKWLRNTCEEKKNDVYLVGEAWDSYEVSKQFTDALGRSFNFEMQGRIIDHVLNGTELSIVGTDKDCYFLDNHDMDRFASMLGHNQDKIKQALNVLKEMPGDIYVYYGTEISVPGTKVVTDADVRKPMEWNSVDSQFLIEGSAFNSFKQIFRGKQYE